MHHVAVRPILVDLSLEAESITSADKLLNQDCRLVMSHYALFKAGFDSALALSHLPLIAVILVVDLLVSVLNLILVKNRDG